MVGGVAVFVSLFLLGPDNFDPRDPWTFVIYGPMYAWFIRLAVLCVRVSPSGLVIRNSFRTYQVSWLDIEEIAWGHAWVFNYLEVGKIGGGRISIHTFMVGRLGPGISQSGDALHELQDYLEIAKTNAVPS